MRTTLVDRSNSRWRLRESTHSIFIDATFQRVSKRNKAGLMSSIVPLADSESVALDALRFSGMTWPKCLRTIWKGRSLCSKVCSKQVNLFGLCQAFLVVGEQYFVYGSMTCSFPSSGGTLGVYRMPIIIFNLASSTEV